MRILTLQKTDMDTRDLCEFLDRVSDSCRLEILDCRKNVDIIPTPELPQALSRHNKLTVLQEASASADRKDMYYTMQSFLQTTASRRNILGTNPAGSSGSSLTATSRRTVYNSSAAATSSNGQH